MSGRGCGSVFQSVNGNREWHSRAKQALTISMCVVYVAKFKIHYKKVCETYIFEFPATVGIYIYINPYILPLFNRGRSIWFVSMQQPAGRYYHSIPMSTVQETHYWVRTEQLHEEFDLQNLWSMRPRRTSAHEPRVPIQNPNLHKSGSVHLPNVEFFMATQPDLNLIRSPLGTYS